MPKYVVLACARSELNALPLELELRATGAPFVRFNVDETRSKELSLSLTDSDWSLTDERTGTTILNTQVGAIWARGLRVATSQIDQLHPVAQSFAQSEWHRAIAAFLYSTNAQWMNSPLVLPRSGNRLIQMQLAKTCGLAVPAWMVSTGNAPLRPSFDGPYVTKIINPGGYRECGGLTLNTTRVPHTLTALEKDAKLYPILVQQRVDPVYVVRAYYIGGRILAAAASITFDDSLHIDSRRYNQQRAYYTPYSLPVTIMEQLSHLCLALGLEYGAADFLVDANGCHWFLEVNPSGQWGWIEQESYLPITNTIAYRLCELAYQA